MILHGICIVYRPLGALKVRFLRKHTFYESIAKFIFAVCLNLLSALL